MTVIVPQLAKAPRSHFQRRYLRNFAHLRFLKWWCLGEAAVFEPVTWKSSPVNPATDTQAGSCVWCVKSLYQQQLFYKHMNMVNTSRNLCVCVRSAIKRWRNVLSPPNEVHQNSEASTNEPPHTRGEGRRAMEGWGGDEVLYIGATCGQICLFHEAIDEKMCLF